MHETLRRRRDELLRRMKVVSLHPQRIFALHFVNTPYESFIISLKNVLKERDRGCHHGRPIIYKLLTEWVIRDYSLSVIPTDSHNSKNGR